MSSLYIGLSFTLANIVALKVIQVLRHRAITNDSPSTVNVAQETTISAPGKALIAGGYLVLEEPNIGVVISSSSRFYTTIKVLPGEKASLIQNPYLSIVVESPQFHTSFQYTYDAHKNKLFQVSENSNEFVEKCLALTLAFVKEWHGETRFTSILNSISSIGKLGIKLRADNDFYSQIRELRRMNLPFLSSSLSLLPKFLPCPIDPCTGKLLVSKTGMGSSAALTTSLVGALLQYFSVIRLGHRKADEDRSVLHNLAQLCHAIAQGKIGSGFDISAAVHGSQVYTRFSAYPFNACMSSDALSSTIFRSVMDKKLWSCSMRPLVLPAGLDLLMGDVCGGSSSASMAKEVLAWKARVEKCVAGSDKDDSEGSIWSDLRTINALISKHLASLCEYSMCHHSTYEAMLAWAAARPSNEWSSYASTKTIPHWVEPLTLLLSIKSAFSRARSLLKRMGQAAGVDIEPDCQTMLVDATEKLPGVLAAGVPGAGGVDAIFAITISEVSRSEVELMWASWAGEGLADREEPGGRSMVCPLMLRADVGLRAGVRAEEMVY